MTIVCDIALLFDTSLALPQAVADGLSPARLEKALRFKQAIGAWRIAAGEWLVRFLVQSYFPHCTTNFKLTYEEAGNPVFEPEIGLFYSLSHAGNRVAVMVSDKKCGVDIEKNRPIDLRVGRHIFSESEMAAVQSAPEAEQNVLFFQTWALKESLAKWEKSGISAHLRHITFVQEQDAWLATGHPEEFFPICLPTDTGFTLCALAEEKSVQHLSGTLDLGKDGFVVQML